MLTGQSDIFMNHDDLAVLKPVMICQLTFCIGLKNMEFFRLKKSHHQNSGMLIIIFCILEISELSKSKEIAWITGYMPYPRSF